MQASTVRWTRLPELQEISFHKAQAFGFAAITGSSTVSIEPTLEYDGKPRSLKRSLLMEVLKACGVKVNDRTPLLARRRWLRGAAGKTPVLRAAGNLRSCPAP